MTTPETLTEEEREDLEIQSDVSAKLLRIHDQQQARIRELEEGRRQWQQEASKDPSVRNVVALCYECGESCVIRHKRTCSRVRP